MSEMLGNQYFLARNFEKALQQYEAVLDNAPVDEIIRKKLIICYCEVGNVDAAVALFDQVIHTNIDIIALTDVVSEDCPCPELLERMKWYEKVAANSFDFYCIVGMLSLYCDLNNSLKYFSTAQKLRPYDQRISRILKTIRSYHRTHTTL